MIQIAVIGPGAIGGTMAAWLGEVAGHSITLAVRTPFAHLKLDAPTCEIRTSPHIVTEPAQASIMDWVLIATKAYDAATTAPWLERMLGEHTHVAVLQNGVEHIARFRPYVRPERILPVMVDCPAERIAPGHIHQRGPARLRVPKGAAGEAFVELFARTEVNARTNDDFHSQLWRKLCLNSVGALSAIVLRPSVIARHDGVADLMRAIVRECIAVGRAEGASLNDDLADSIVESYRKAPPDSINSLHADRVAGRPMEIDARNGAIVRFGRRHGIETPLNSMLVTLLEAASLPT
jgi:2-dehydropantoate 2-reductase